MAGSTLPRAGQAEGVMWGWQEEERAGSVSVQLLSLWHRENTFGAAGVELLMASLAGALLSGQVAQPGLRRRRPPRSALTRALFSTHAQSCCCLS